MAETLPKDPSVLASILGITVEQFNSDPKKYRAQVFNALNAGTGNNTHISEHRGKHEGDKKQGRFKP